MAKRGSYVLVMFLPENREITAGKLRPINFNCGFYVYVGSAMGGLKSRLSRHLRKQKKLHWHIDYLLQYATISSVLVIESDTRQECVIAGEIGKMYVVIAGFGSSDCTCPGHLFYSEYEPSENICKLVTAAGIPSRRLNTVKERTGRND